MRLWLPVVVRRARIFVDGSIAVSVSVFGFGCRWPAGYVGGKPRAGAGLKVSTGVRIAAML